jgi:hypothetical protein
MKFKSRVLSPYWICFLIIAGVGGGSGCVYSFEAGSASLSPDTQVTATPTPGDTQPAGGTGTDGNVYITQAKSISDGVESGQTSLTVSPDSGYVLSSVFVDLGADFQTTNVCSGRTIFGRAGAAICQGTSGGTNATAANVLTGTYFWNSTGNSVEGTMAIGSSFVGSNAWTVLTIPAGYYDGTETATAADTNLVASNIVSGTSIFGVNGNATVESHSLCSGSNQFGCVSTATYLTQSTPDTPAAAANVLTGKEFYVGGALITGTMATGSNVTGTNGSLSATIPVGYHDGTKTASMSDTDLTGSNICTTRTIFGTAGSAICQSGTTNSGAVAEDMISGKEAWDSAGTKMTGTITNRGTLDASTAFPGSGYYSATVSNAPGASAICSGTTVFGTAGSATCGGGISLNSNAFRDQETTVISQAAETTTYAGAALPSGYRDVPRIDQYNESTKDTEGTVDSGVTLVVRDSFINCGTTQNTIAGRISDCATNNGDNATWDGAVKANAGQGQWKLVTRQGVNQEVWQDHRTGLLWSSVLSDSSTNWCVAAGNAQYEYSSAPWEMDGGCGNTDFQPDYPTAQSWCAESGPTAMQAVTGSGENWSNGTYSAAKGGMGKTSTASSPSVRWRLPTKYDYQAADINGIRFVMPDMKASGGNDEWSASLWSFSAGYAWYFDVWSGGGFSHRSRAYIGSTSVRCVGR